MLAGMIRKIEASSNWFGCFLVNFFSTSRMCLHKVPVVQYITFADVHVEVKRSVILIDPLGSVILSSL